MGATALIIIFAMMLVYVDFAIWYCAWAHNRWSDKKWKFRGILFKFWDWLGR